MTQFLPPNLLALFAARDPVPFLPPAEKLSWEKKRTPYTGVAEYLDHFEIPEETPPPVKPETRQQRRERKRRDRAEQNAYRIEQDLALWDPQANDEATSDPYKTLFIGRINYDTSETKLRREFEVYGKIKQIKMVHDKHGKPRGYAFIEYENENDMHSAYKRADGKKIDNRRVVVDIERGRTIKGWRPRRLGGGKGGRKNHAPQVDNGTLEEQNNNVSSRYDERERDGGGSRRRDGSRERRRSRSRDRDRKRASRSRSKSRERKRRSKSRERHRSRSNDRSNKKAKRSRSRDRVDKEHAKNGRGTNGMSAMEMDQPMVVGGDNY